MVTDQQVIELVRHANPVPDINDLPGPRRSALALLSLAAPSPSTNGAVTEAEEPSGSTPSPSGRSSWRGPAIAVGVAIVVIVIGVGLAWASGIFAAAPEVSDEDPTPVTEVPPPTSVELPSSVDSWPVDRPHGDQFEDGFAAGSTSLGDHGLRGVSHDRFMMGFLLFAIVDDKPKHGLYLGQACDPEQEACDTRDTNYAAHIQVDDAGDIWGLMGDSVVRYEEGARMVPVATVPAPPEGWKLKNQSGEREPDLSLRHPDMYLSVAPDGAVWVIVETHETAARKRRRAPSQELRAIETEQCLFAHRLDGDAWTTIRCAQIPRHPEATQAEYAALPGADGVLWVANNGWPGVPEGTMLHRIDGDTVESYTIPNRCDQQELSTLRDLSGLERLEAAREDPYYVECLLRPSLDLPFRLPQARAGTDGSLWLIYRQETQQEIVRFHEGSWDRFNRFDSLIVPPVWTNGVSLFDSVLAVGADGTPWVIAVDAETHAQWLVTYNGRTWDRIMELGGCWDPTVWAPGWDCDLGVAPDGTVWIFTPASVSGDTPGYTVHRLEPTED